MTKMVCENCKKSGDELSVGKTKKEFIAKVGMNKSKMHKWFLYMMDSIGNQKYSNMSCLFQLAHEAEEHWYAKLKILPSELNLLDNLNLNETHYSSIMAALWSLTDGYGEHVFLKSFVETETDFDINIIKPCIAKEVRTLNGDRIDILIWEKDKYAIIVENKIFNALSTPNQIGKYIDYVLSNDEINVCKNQVYVVYLIKNKVYNPYCADPSIWIANDGSSYKRGFLNRTNYIDFRQDVLLWLENVSMPLSKTMSPSVRLSVQQFIDNLEGIFKIRKRDKIMTNEMNKFLSMQLCLKENYKENIISIEDKLEQLEELKQDLQNLMRAQAFRLLKEWTKVIEKRIGSGLICHVSLEESYPYVRIPIPYKSTKENVVVELLYTDDGFLLGITKDEARTYLSRLELLADSTVSQIGTISARNKNGWFRNTYVTTEDALEHTCRLVRLVQEYML